MDWIVLLFGGSLFSFAWKYICYLPNIIAAMFGIYWCHINDNETSDNARKHLFGLSMERTYRGSALYPSGLIVGKWFIAYVDESITNGCIRVCSITILARESFIVKICKKPESEMDTDVSELVRKVNSYVRSGPYHNLWYQDFVYNTERIANNEQAAIIASIRKIYKKKKHATILLHGPPRTGKTQIAVLLSVDLNGSFCNTFNPSEPGDTLSNLFRVMAPKSSNPLVILFDEVDSIIKKIHDPTGMISPVNNGINCPIQVHDKRTLNMFLDNMELYHHVILIMTTNKSKKELDDIDSSHFGIGRVDGVYETTQLAHVES
jgi:hypothetical protein